MSVSLVIAFAAIAAGPAGTAARTAADREIPELIQQLGHARFEDREHASRRLRLIGPLALPAAAGATEHSSDPEIRQRAGELVRRFRAELFGPQRTLSGDGRPLYAAAFSPDGKRVAAGGDGRKVHVWDVATGKRIAGWAVDQEPCGLVFARDGNSVFVGGYGGQVCRLELSTGKVILEYSPSGGTTCYDLAVAPDDSAVLAIGQDRIDLWDTTTGKRLLRFPDAKIGYAYGCAFSPDGRRLIVTKSEGAASVWEVPVRGTPADKPVLSVGGGSIFGIVFSPDGKRIVAGLMSGQVRVWNAATGKEELTISAHRGAACRPSFSPDGRLIASPGHDHAVRLWDAATGKLLHAYNGHSDMVLRAEFSPDGRLLLSTGRDGFVRLWRVAP